MTVISLVIHPARVVEYCEEFDYLCIHLNQTSQLTTILQHARPMRNTMDSADWE